LVGKDVGIEVSARYIAIPQAKIAAKEKPTKATSFQIRGVRFSWSIILLLLIFVIPG
jgi:hypothetical protein